MAAYYPIVPGVYEYAKGFENLPFQDLRYLGAIITKYTWIPAALKEPYRKKDNFLFSDFVGFDVDNTGDVIYPLEQAIQDWCDSACVIGVTRNHQKEKVTKGTVFPPQDRFRIITQWERRIETIEEYEYNVTKILKANEVFDAACKDATRAFYPCQKIVFANFDGFKQPVKPFEKKEISLQEAVKLYVNSKSNRISKSVDNFIKNGVPFKSGRNDSVYISTLELLDKGTPAKKVLELLHESPFDRAEFSDHELESAYLSAVKRHIQKHKKIDQ